MRKNFSTHRNRKVEKKNLNKFTKIKWKCIDHEKTTQKQRSVSGTLDVSGSPFHQDPSRNTWTLLAFWRPGPTAFTRSTTDFRTHFCFFSQQVEVHWSWKNNTKTEKCFWNAWCFRSPFHQDPSRNTWTLLAFWRPGPTAFTRSTTDFRTHFCFFSQQVEVHWSWKNNTKTEKCFWNAWCFRVPFSSRSLKEYMDPAGVLKARTHSLHSINNWLSHSFLFLFTTSFFFSNSRFYMQAQRYSYQKMIWSHITQRDFVVTWKQNRRETHRKEWR